MTLLWLKHGPHMFLQISYSWILITVPRDVQYQILHCCVYPMAPFLINGQNMALSCPKHGYHMILQLGLSWILINVPRDIPCQISYCWVYPVAPFLEMAKIWPFYGQKMVLTWSAHDPTNWFVLNFNQCAQDCSITNFTLLGVSCSLLS